MHITSLKRSQIVVKTVVLTTVNIVPIIAYKINECTPYGKGGIGCASYFPRECMRFGVGGAGSFRITFLV